eukprot:2001982-Rhodomonas_salina.1
MADGSPGHGLARGRTFLPSNTCGLLLFCAAHEPREPAKSKANKRARAVQRGRRLRPMRIDLAPACRPASRPSPGSRR